ncbi:MAG: DUF721 domain-containing protein [Ilumatobacteraceae bacterium]
MVDRPNPRPRDPRPLGDVLAKLLQRIKVVDQREGVELFRSWREIVGDAIADNVSPKRLENRVLTVEVVDNAWATQLRFLETRLISTLRERAGDEVDSLQIRVKRPR